MLKYEDDAMRNSKGATEYKMNIALLYLVNP